MKKPVTVAELVRKAGKARMAGMTSEERKAFSRAGVMARMERRKRAEGFEYNGFDMTPPPPGVKLGRTIVLLGDDLFRRIAWCDKLMGLDKTAAVVIPGHFSDREIRRIEANHRTRGEFRG